MSEKLEEARVAGLQIFFEWIAVDILHGEDIDVSMLCSSHYTCSIVSSHHDAMTFHDPQLRADEIKRLLHICQLCHDEF